MGKFEAGFPSGVESLMAGRVKYGEDFENVGQQLDELGERWKKSLMLLVASDRISGFFENRGGVANGPMLVKLVRGLAEELGLAIGTKADVTKKEAKGYYDELVSIGALDCAKDLGVKNVFGTVWEMINKEITIRKV